MEDDVNRACVVLDIEPVADILAPAIHRQRFAMTDIIDKERDKLLRELVRPVIVRAVRHDRRHPVGIVESPDEMVGRCL